MHLLDFADDQEELLLQTEQEWNAFAASVRVGEAFAGRVVAVRNYGVFVDFGAPFPALVETPNLRRDRMPVDVDHLPQIGEAIHGEIIQIVPHRRFVRAIERAAEL